MTSDTSRIGEGALGLDAVRMPAGDNRVLLRRVEHEGSFYRVCSIVNMERSDHDTRIHEFVIGRGGIRILDRAETTPGVIAGIERSQPVAP